MGALRVRLRYPGAPAKRMKVTHPRPHLSTLEVHPRHPSLATQLLTLNRGANLQALDLGAPGVADEAGRVLRTPASRIPPAPPR